MKFFSEAENQRQEKRVSAGFPVRISIGSQITLQGVLKDISLKSAFINIKSNIFIKTNDEVGFAIQFSKDASDVIEGTACVSRIVIGEGLAIYFIKMDKVSLNHLKDLLQTLENHQTGSA